MKIRHLVYSLLVMAVAANAMAQEKTGARGYLSSLDGTLVIASPAEAAALSGTVTPPIDLTGIDSIDGPADPDNVVLTFDIGAGNQVTGISFDMGIATIGDSWCSEADVFFTDSAVTTGVVLTPGVGIDENCDQEFSSGGVDDVTEFDVIAGADGILRVEFAESFDDNADAADANLRNAVAPVVAAGMSMTCTDQTACDVALGGAGGPDLPPAPAVPTLSLFGMLALALVLALGTALVLRRKA